MSSLSFAEKRILETAFNMASGYVLDFSDASFADFFNDCGINIDAQEYRTLGDSKANRLRTFWQIGDDEHVGKSLVEMANLMIADVAAKRSGSSAGWMTQGATAIFEEKRKMAEHVRDIGNRILTNQDSSVSRSAAPATIDNNLIHIEIRPEIYSHIKQYLDAKDYFHAVEESYKVVREKLREMTGQEQAHKAFSETNYEKIFGHVPQSDVEKDFFEGVKFLHMALQHFRNEKAHSLAEDLDKNLAIHYLSLASLAYDLISSNEKI